MSLLDSLLRPSTARPANLCTPGGSRLSEPAPVQRVSGLAFLVSLALLFAGCANVSADDTDAEQGERRLESEGEAGSGVSHAGSEASAGGGVVEVPEDPARDSLGPGISGSEPVHEIEGPIAPPDVPLREDPGTWFEERYAPGLSDHVFDFAVGDFGFGYGVGGGMLDFDGDGDIDVFLGTNAAYDGSVACLYENKSTPGTLRFECRTPMMIGRKITGAWPIDVNGDGKDELIVVGENWGVIEQFLPVRNRTDLLSLAEVDEQCTAASVLVFDQNLDGIADILLGCRSDNGPTLTKNARRNHLFLGRGDGQFDWLDPTFSEPFAALFGGMLSQLTNTLALAQSDVDGDGLLDLHMINDTFSNERSRRTSADPGGVFRRCRPDQVCDYEKVHYRDDTAAWGSYMSVAIPWTETIGLTYFLADWGPNRLLEWDGATFLPRAARRGLEMRGERAQYVFSWGSVVADFNFDGTDDLFVSQGSMKLGRPSENDAGELAFRDQRDLLMLQDTRGYYHEFGSSVGIPLPDYEPGSPDFFPRGSRAAAFVDLDGDGYGELFVLPYLGFLRILSEFPDDATRRCTLIPRSRYVVTYGEAYEIRTPLSGGFRHRQSQGQMQLGRPNAILVEGMAGDLRFPSGAVVPWACSPEQPTAVVEEPDWLRVSAKDGTLRVEIRADFGVPVEAVDAYFRTSNDATATGLPMTAGEDEGVFTRPFRANNVQVMLRINGKFLGRWFDLSSLSE